MDWIMTLVLMMLIGGMIGYVTNKVAIKMLFRPINPVKVLFFTFQGVFPKRKDQMAISLADTIERELLTKEAIISNLFDDDKIEELKVKIMDILVRNIVEAIPPTFKMFMGGDPEAFIKGLIEKNGSGTFEEILNLVIESSNSNLNIREMVKERIDALDFVEFEKIIFGLMSRELRHIEVIGLFLGMIIGFVQFLITLI